MSSACESVARLLSPYLDDQLSGANRGAVDRHLQTCTACKGRLADITASRAALRSYLDAQMAEVDLSGFSRRVTSAIKAEPLGLGQRISLWWAELMAYHSTVIYSSLGAATAAAMAVAVVTSRPLAGPVSNEMVVHSLEVSDPSYEPVVMHTDDGETVIMVVRHQDDPDEEASPDAAASPAKKKGAEDLQAPHGGNL
jgi:anti-sigma factor RsiW